MTPRILLVQPPVYDFTAYDYWLKPFGLLSVAGQLRGRAEMTLFDFLDRSHSQMDPAGVLRKDRWGRGAYREVQLGVPNELRDIQRRFKRFGLPVETFRSFLRQREPFDVVLIQTGMTYWYLGVDEVLREIQERNPRTTTVLGGPYASLCMEHARARGADLVVEGSDLGSLWTLLGMEGGEEEPPLWEAYETIDTGVLRLIRGCPFRCTYCASHRLYPSVGVERWDRNLAALDKLIGLGCEQLVFYDDALLYKAQEVLIPFLEEAKPRLGSCRIHTPNAVHARWVTEEAAHSLVSASLGFVYLGLENVSPGWQESTGDKVSPEEFLSAVEAFRSAGLPASRITAYVLLGHPDDPGEGTEETLRFAHKAGIRSMLAEFSPIPGTPDGDRCGRWADMSEPLHHNKTAFVLRRLGKDKVNELKTLCRTNNESL